MDRPKPLPLTHNEVLLRQIETRRMINGFHTNYAYSYDKYPETFLERTFKDYELDKMVDYRLPVFGFLKELAPQDFIPEVLNAPIETSVFLYMYEPDDMISSEFRKLLEKVSDSLLNCKFLQISRANFKDRLRIDEVPTLLIYKFGEHVKTIERPDRLLPTWDARELKILLRGYLDNLDDIYGAFPHLSNRFGKY